MLAAPTSDFLADSDHGLQYLLFPVHVRLLTGTIVTVEVELNSTIQHLCNQVGRFHAAIPLKWPSTSRSSHASSWPPISWNTPAALRLCHCGWDLSDDSTLAQSGVRPGSHLSAHMYFSQTKSVGDIHLSEIYKCRSKHVLAPDDDDYAPVTPKRQKFN